ncbi:MAG: tail fiber protein [Candidatus Korobacteraceae bacterium]
MEPFLGSLLLVPYNFAPQGWALCNGQLLSIQQNTALFSLLGTTYGGDGISTFALPDLRGRVPISAGQGPGLQQYVLGQSGGAESATLGVTQLPAHNHSVNTVSTPATGTNPANQYLATSTAPAVGGVSSIYSSAQPNSTLNPNAVSQTGGSQPVDIRSPYLTFNWIIALNGIYPSRG